MVMENNMICNYYENIIEELSRPGKPIVFSKHNCSYSYYDEKGNLIVIKTCEYFEAFEKCKFYKSK